MADPTSYCIGAVFSLESSQLTGNKSGGSVWSVAASYGTDIRLFFSNEGVGYQKVTYRHNGVQLETSAHTFDEDTVNIIVVTYDGTTFYVWLNGIQLFSGAAPSAGVGASDLLLGALTEGEGEYGGNFNFGGYLYDFAIFSTHDTAERQKLEGYFAHTHAITDLLAGSHPYKTSFPEL
jgi:hypothetical protein